MFIQSHVEDQYWVIGGRWDHNDEYWRHAGRYDETRWMNMHGRFIQPPHFEFGPFLNYEDAVACLRENQHLAVEPR